MNFLLFGRLRWPHCPSALRSAGKCLGSRFRPATKRPCTKQAWKVPISHARNAPGRGAKQAWQMRVMYRSRGTAATARSRSTSSPAVAERSLDHATDACVCSYLSACCKQAALPAAMSRVAMTCRPSRCVKPMLQGTESQATRASTVGSGTNSFLACAQIRRSSKSLPIWCTLPVRCWATCLKHAAGSRMKLPMHSTGDVFDSAGKCCGLW